MLLSQHQHVVVLAYEQTAQQFWLFIPLAKPESDVHEVTKPIAIVAQTAM